LIPAEVLSVPVNTTDPILQPGDLLNIEVSASNYTAVAPFNKGRYVDPETGGLISAPRNTSTNGSGAASLDYYLVDKDGNITFPIVGPLHVAGLTKTQAQGLVAEAICPKYLKELPVVDIRFVNFRVTVLGAVSSPGIKKSENESLNIFEAIAMAGDLDIKADRENIVLIRTNSDGAREVHKLNVHDKDMLLSPYYNLQPNDLLLVNWNRSGAQNAWQMNQAFTTTLTVVGGVSAVLGLTLSIINLAD
jgi:polysaccharide export outer membrane protein